MLKLFIDENLDQRILRGVRVHIPNLTYIVAQEAGLARADDATLLEWAAENRRVLVTHDRETMLRTVNKRLRAGRRMPGLVIVRQELPLGKAIEDLVLLLECSTESDLENRVVFIPL